VTTNQKAAGSSPANRAKEIPRFAGEKRSEEKGLGINPALLTESSPEFPRTLYAGSPVSENTLLVGSSVNRGKPLPGASP
jgi:hypothetical protein